MDIEQIDEFARSYLVCRYEVSERDCLDDVFDFIIDQPREPDDLFEGTVVSLPHGPGQLDALLGIQSLDAVRSEKLLADFIFMLSHLLHGDRQMGDTSAPGLDIFFFGPAEKVIETLAGLKEILDNFIGDIFARKDEGADHPDIVG